MAGGINVQCLYSTVRNDSGVSKVFSFLPPHGRRLAANEEFTVFGDIKQAIIKHDRLEARRAIIAFERAIQRGDMTILNTPSVILEDDANPGADPKMIRMHNGTLGLTDVCWAGSTSEEQDLG